MKSCSSNKCRAVLFSNTLSTGSEVAQLSKNRTYSGFPTDCEKQIQKFFKDQIYDFLADLKFSTLESWSRDPFLQVSALVLVLKLRLFVLEPSSLGFRLGTTTTWSWSLVKLTTETKLENFTLNYDDSDIPKHLDVARTCKQTDLANE